MHGPGNCLVNVVHLVDLNLLHVELDNGKFSSMLYVHAVMGHSTLHDIISNNKFIMSFLKGRSILHPARKYMDLDTRTGLLAVLFSFSYPLFKLVEHFFSKCLGFTRFYCFSTIALPLNYLHKVNWTNSNTSVFILLKVLICIARRAHVTSQEGNQDSFLIHSNLGMGKRYINNF